MKLATAHSILPSPQCTKRHADHAPSNTIQFGNSPSAHTFEAPVQLNWMDELCYKGSTWLFSLDGRIANWAERFMQGKNGPLKYTVATIERLARMTLDYDFKEFPRLFSMKISEPAMGSLLMLLFPFTVGGRLLRAIERGRPKDDYREVGDILRRDLSSITILVFALKPMLNLFNSIKEKIDGLKFVDAKKELAGLGIASGGADSLWGNMISYSNFAKYYQVHSPDSLTTMIQAGNGEGLRNALRDFIKRRGADLDISKLAPLPAISDQQIAALATQFEKAGYTALTTQDIPDVLKRLDAKSFEGRSLQHLLQTLENKLAQLIPAVEQRQESAKALADEVFVLGKLIDQNKHEALQQAENTASKTAGKLLSKLPEFEQFVVRYARKARLPLDLIAFAIACLGIGLLPVKFNDWYNRIQFERKMEHKRRTTQSNVDPTLMFNTLKQSSRLSSNFKQH